MKRMVRLFMLLLATGCWAEVNRRQELVKAEIYGNGAISVEEGQETLAEIAPRIFPMGWELQNLSVVNGADGRKTISGNFLAPGNGAVITLTGSIAESQGGLDVEYDFVASAAVTVEEVASLIELPVECWRSAKYQLGLHRGTVTQSLISSYTSGQECLSVIGPSSDGSNLFLEIDGDNRLATSFIDNRGEGEPSVELRLLSDKTLDPRVLVPEGKKTIRFKIRCNRMIQVNPVVQDAKKSLTNQPQSSKDDFSGKAIQKVGENQPAGGVSGIIDTAVPKDAVAVPFHAEKSWGDYQIFLPVEMDVADRKFEGWVQLDTNVKPYNIDLNISQDLLNQFHLRILRVRKGYSGGIDTNNGDFTSELNPYNVISNDDGSDAGKVDVEVKIGQLRIQNAVLCTDQYLERTYKSFNAYPFFKNKRLIGVFPLSLFKKYLTSIDYPHQMIYFRPLDSERRAFFSSGEKETMDCDFTDDGALIPISINGKVSGSGFFDTGASMNLMDISQVDISNLPFTSYKLGGYDVLKNNPGYYPEFFKAFTGGWKPKKIFALVGNDIFENMFITADPRFNKIYIERIDAR